jgi:hypothetical protein
MLLEAIIDHMNISNREELIGTLRQASQPNPQHNKAATTSNKCRWLSYKHRLLHFQGQAARV